MHFDTVFTALPAFNQAQLSADNQHKVFTTSHGDTTLDATKICATNSVQQTVNIHTYLRLVLFSQLSAAVVTAVRHKAKTV